MPNDIHDTSSSDSSDTSDWDTKADANGVIMQNGIAYRKSGSFLRRVCAMYPECMKFRANTYFCWTHRNANIKDVAHYEPTTPIKNVNKKKGEKEQLYIHHQIQIMIQHHQIQIVIHHHQI